LAIFFLMEVLFFPKPHWSSNHGGEWHRPRTLWYWPETGDRAGEWNLGPVKRLPCKVRDSNPLDLPKHRAQKGHKKYMDRAWKLHRSCTDRARELR
jgi:hypothetical protein